MSIHDRRLRRLGYPDVVISSFFNTEKRRLIKNLITYADFQKQSFDYPRPKDTKIIPGEIMYHRTPKTKEERDEKNHRAALSYKKCETCTHLFYESMNPRCKMEWMVVKDHGEELMHKWLIEENTPQESPGCNYWKSSSNASSTAQASEEFSKIKVSFVKHCPGHKNSKGEASPWCIVSHTTGKILSSHSSKEQAKKHLQDMHAHGG